MAPPLDQIKILDLTIGGVGPWATMILASMGADVIKIENPDTWSKYQGGGPTYQGLSVVYMHCQLGKRSAFLNLKTPEGHGTGQLLLRGADVVIDNMSLGAVDRLGLGFEEALKHNPRIVSSSHPGWGDTGPLKDLGSGDLTSQAFSGLASITGRRGGEGEFLRWYALHDFTPSLYIVASTLLGLLQRERTGRGAKVTSPQQPNTIAIQTSRIAEFLVTGENVPLMGSACTTTVPHRAFLCQDRRWLAVGVMSDIQWRGLCKALNAKDLLKDSRIVTNPGRVQHREEVEDRLEAIFKSLPARWWVIQLRKHKVPVSLFYKYEEIPNLPQVKGNRYIVPIKYPKVGTLPFANLPFQLSKTPVDLKPGPWPGQDTERVTKDGWGQNGAVSTKGYFGPRGGMEKGVLDGVTVVDMTQGLAGPYASLLLADAGAGVTKIEPPEGDYARDWGPPMVDGVGAAFFHLNRNKEGIRLDIRKNQDRRKLVDLLKAADIFIEDAGQPTMKRLGLSYQDIEKVNPGLVYCTITAHGTKGPLRNQPASELTLQAMSDFLNNLGAPDEEPVRMGPDMASLSTSLFVVQGVLGALYHKWHTGEGQQVTVSMLGTLMFQRGITWAAVVSPDRWDVGFLLGYVTPPDCGYKAADRQIIMNAPRNPDVFPSLLEALGMEAYLEHPLFQHPPSQLMGFGFGGNTPIGNRPYLAKPIWEEAFKKWNAADLVILLQKFGCNAFVMNDYRHLFSHPQVKAFGIFKEAEHPKLGRIRYLGQPWKIHGAGTVSFESLSERR